MRLRRYPNGFAVLVAGHRWDYWLPGRPGSRRWMPLSIRGRVRWWGAITYHRTADDGTQEAGDG